MDREVPEDLDIHLVVDNYTPHKHLKIKAWIAKRSRYHLHFTPTYASWLNQVGRWFGLITQRAIKRNSVRNVKHLVKTIEEFTHRYNQEAKPFVWVATAQSILDKLERLSIRITGDTTLAGRAIIQGSSLGLRRRPEHDDKASPRANAPCQGDASQQGDPFDRAATGGPCASRSGGPRHGATRDPRRVGIANQPAGIA